MTNEQPSVAELLDLLGQSQRLLDEATLIERGKRRRLVSKGLEEALAGCSGAAREGYQQATEHLARTRDVIGQVQQGVSRFAHIAQADEGSAAILDCLKQSVSELQVRHDETRNEVEEKYRHLTTFNLTLFGRTMSGKSTLMEILTRGEGKSIGNGAQRTTRDVRKYEWQGLTVTDVPGIAAFAGEVDEETAHEAASQADLVLFLITDDAPQAAEAEHLARLRQQGRHVLGICNVKEALNSDLAISRFIRDHHKLFDAGRMGELSSQFDAMADQYTPGRELKLVHTHLQAQFLAGRPENSAAPWRDQLDKASRFWEVEDHILDHIAAHGIFLRQRSFLDSAAATDLDATEAMLEGASLFEQLHRRLTDRVSELRSWRESFSRDAIRQFDRLIQETIGSLRGQIPAFAEEHCEDKELPEKWNRRLQSANIEQNIREMQEQLAEECQQYFKTLIEEVQEEIRLVEINAPRVSIETGPILDTRKMWNWGVAGASAGLGVLTAGLWWAGVALGLTPVGWALMGTAAVLGLAGLFSRLFGSRDKKRREAIAKITPELRKNLEDIEKQVRAAANKWLNEFTGQYLNKVAEQFNSLTSAYGQAATISRETAWRQRDALLDLNRQTIELALQHLGHPDAIPNIVRAARIPGQGQALMTAGAFRLPGAAVEALESLFNESVVQVSDQLNTQQIIETLTAGHDHGEPIRIDDTSRTALMYFDPNDVEGSVRIRLAGQLTGYHISNLTGE